MSDSPSVQSPSLEQIRGQLNEKLNPKGKNGKSKSNRYVKDVFPFEQPPHAIYEEDGCNYKQHFTHDGADVKLHGEPQEVVQRWMPKSLAKKSPKKGVPGGAALPSGLNKLARPGGPKKDADGDYD